MAAVYPGTIFPGNRFFLGVTSLEDYSNINIGIVERADAVFLALVVEAYLTYGKSDSNGTTTSIVKSIFRTFFDKKSATKDELKI